jgi:hypothetical protein
VFIKSSTKDILSLYLKAVPSGSAILKTVQCNFIFCYYSERFCLALGLVMSAGLNLDQHSS